MTKSRCSWTGVKNGNDIILRHRATPKRKKMAVSMCLCSKKQT